MDYARLRNQTLDSGQEEEAVTVNTRALIDKVLARYSGEWTTLRELIQNAADASASKVSIKFETLPSSTVPTPQSTDAAARLKHTMLHHTLRSLIVSNNGQAFAPTDWARLKRIAEGNPDETKIGAFGVGFYSVFAECENPFVTSGKDTMAFFWKGNSLFTRRGKLPAEVDNTDTCFVLDYRNTTTSIPSLMSVCQFLCTSMTFVGLETIELWVDNWNIMTLTKKSAPATSLAIPKDIETRTREGMMRIQTIDRQNAQLDASWMNIVGWNPAAEKLSSTQDQDRSSSGPSLRSFFSRLTGSAQNSAAAKKAAQEEAEAQLAIAEDLVGRSQATVFIRVNHVHIKTQVTSAFAAELERATKKPPPKMTKIAILTSSYDETEASMSTLSGASAKKVAAIVTGVLPRKAGRVFIGFPTAQTTGLLAHISAPSIIPTVERENIDLNARWVKTWNTELLAVAGIACRIAYSGEMATLRDKLRVTDGNLESLVQKHLPSATHILEQFTFRESTPLSKAGEIIEEYFWISGKASSIEILSSRGVKPSHEVRIASEDLSFVKGLAVVPDKLLKDARPFMLKLKDFGFITDITTNDIKNELEKQALKEEQLHEFLKWAAKKVRCKELEPQVVTSLFAVTVVNVVSEHARPAGSSLLVLGEMAFYINSSKIPPDSPVPKNTIAFEFTKTLNPADMQDFGWEELQIVPWLRWLLNPATRRELGTALDATHSPEFAAQMLATCSKAWESLSQSSKSSVAELLSNETVIPTKLGMRKPADSYFAFVKLFDDLPTIKPSVAGVKEKFLKALGVRKTIELSVIFARLMSQPDASGSDDNKAGWSHVDLVKYLVSVQSDIPEQEIKQLRNTAICPAEADGNSSKGTLRRYRLAELFEPRDDLRELGVPTIQWPGAWNAYSAEGKFLRHLGLREYPTAQEIVSLLAEANAAGESKKFDKILRYFLSNHYKHGYGAYDLHDVGSAFVPAVENGNTVVVRPSECFREEKSRVFGYAVLRRDLADHADKLGVRPDPPIAACADKLIRQPPLDRRQARELFGYFASRLQELSPNLAARLGSTAIVPIQPTDEKQGVRFVAPTACFLGDGEEFGDIFDYVDFGEQPNMFLIKVGSKHEPSTTELARQIISAPARILNILQTEKYLGLLRKLHSNMGIIKRDKNLWKDMKKAPFLLAYQEIPVPVDHKKSAAEAADYLDDDEPESRTTKDWRLRAANHCIIVDDFKSYRLFSDQLVVAPQEETLEELYASLGALFISSLVENEPRLGGLGADQREAEHLRGLILERAQLFLHEQPANTLKHDMRWLSKNLAVQTVSSISLRISLRGTRISHTESRNAWLSSSSQTKAVLSLTPKPDLWQVSHAVVSLLIERPKQQTLMAFENLLGNSLLKLRKRGYNVDRILRRKAAEEARNTELENQRREEEQRQRQRELETNRATMVAANAAVNPATHQPATESTGLLGGDHDRSLVHTPKQHNAMPGTFDESPDPGSANSDLARANQTPKNRGLFSSLTRHLGFDDEDAARRSIQNLLGMDPRGGKAQQATPPSINNAPPAPPAPYSPQQIARPHGTGSTAGGVTSAASVQSNLQSAVNASRAWNSNSLFSMPQTNMIKELSSYCDKRPGQDLTLVSTTAAGLPVYLSRASADPTAFVANNSVGIESFAALLRNVGAVFNLSTSTLHVFYDESGNSIAFNSNGSLFCNYRYFAQLHQPSVATPDGAAKAFVYWWVTICHELAHNLVADHGSDHSFYAEQFVAEYFAQAMAMVASLAAQSGANAPRRAIENGVERAFS